MGFSMSGQDLFLSQVEKMIPSDTDVDGYLQEGGQIIAEEMTRIAPIGETGNLQKAIRVGQVRTSKRGRTITVGIHRRDIDLTDKDGHYYPAYVEYGHGGPHPADPHPFIRPAYDLKKDDAWNAIKQAALDKL